MIYLGGTGRARCPHTRRVRRAASAAPALTDHEEVTHLRLLTARVLLDHREEDPRRAVGGWNTLFQYLSFSLLYYLLHAHVYSSVILAMSYVLSSVNGFLGFRYVVFQSTRYPAFPSTFGSSSCTYRCSW